MAKHTQVVVSGFEFDAENDGATVEITLVRIPSGYLTLSSPSALDLPADFREALAGWLDVGNAA